MSTIYDLPVGAIIPWYRPTDSTRIPKGFVPCNGEPIVDGPYRGHRTPDLRNRFICGKNDTAPLELGGGEDVRLSGTFTSKAPRLAAGKKEEGDWHPTNGVVAAYDERKWFGTNIHGHDTEVAFEVKNAAVAPPWVGLIMLMRVH